MSSVICTPQPSICGEILEFCQPGKDLPTNLNQLIQTLPQIFHVGGVDLAALVGTLGVLIQIVLQFWSR